MTDTPKDSIAALLDTELFRGLDPDQVAVLAAAAREEDRKAGESLFRQGDEAKQIFLVRTGKVALTLPMVIRGETREVTLETREAGTLLGWSTLVAPHELTLGAKAVSDVSLVTLTRDRLEEIFAADPALHLATLTNLTEIVGGRLRIFDALLQHDLQKWAAEQG